MTVPDALRVPVAGLAMLAVFGCGPPPAPSSDLDLVTLLPTADRLDGWTVADGPVEHDTGSLYEYLDGGAERFVAHGFRHMVHQRLEAADGTTASVTLDVFDMGSELGAFGIYRAARPPSAAARPWGSEGYRSGTLAAAWQGRVYVHGEADAESEPLTTMLERLVGNTVGRAPGAPGMPRILDPLPETHRVPGSERYVARDLLGHAFLPGGVVAAYVVDGRSAELYFSDLGDSRSAEEAREALRLHHERWAEVEGPAQVGPWQGHRYRDKLLGAGTVLSAERFIAGVHGELDSSEREELLAELVAALTQSARPVS